MAVNKDFRVKNGLIVGDGSGNISAGAGSFAVSLSTTSLSADNLYGNIQDVTYSELSITGGLSSDGLTLTNQAGNVGLGTIDSVSATIATAASAAIFTIGNTSIVTYTGLIVGDNVEFRATNNHSQTINFVSSISQLYAVT